jgi:hypothetical protein
MFVKDRDFWILYNRMMSADMTYEQKQVMFFGARMRYMGANPDRYGLSALEKFKQLIRKRGKKDD